MMIQSAISGQDGENAIGERFALIALTAAFFNAEVTFISLLVWGGIAACYTLTGRVLRSLAR